MSFSKILIKPLLIAFLIIYFLYLVLSRAPAELAAAALHKAVPNLWLTGVSGSAWHGRAGGAQVELPGATLPLGTLSWKLSPISLLFLNPCIRIQTSGTSQLLEGSACQSITGSTSLKNMSIESPVAPLSELLKLPVSGAGSLQIVKAKFKISKNEISSLDAKLTWQNGSINPENAGWISLGSFAGNLKANGNGGITADIFDIQAPLKVQMKADLSPTLAWKLDGTVQPLEQAPAIFKEALGTVGEEKEGVYHVILTGD